jgi:heme-degrading monooxygenase HmoA
VPPNITVFDCFDCALKAVGTIPAHPHDTEGGLKMFARFVTTHLQPGMTGEFKRALETGILPVLKRQEGFQDELALISQDGRDAVGISLWDTKEHAEAYAQKSYPEVERLLSKLTDRTILVQTYEVSVATFSKLAVKSGGVFA